MDTRTMTTEYRLHHWTGIIKECKESGLSVKAYCKHAGFHENRYYYWQKKLREKACIEIINKGKETTSVIPTGFAEIKLAERYAPTSPAMNEDNQVNIEITGIRMVAGANYPAEKLIRLIQEMRPPC